MRCATLALVICITLFAASSAAASPSSASSVREYAHHLVLARWHSESEWRAVESIVEPESAWNPCASYPRHHDCGYAGVNSCGIPQANPCPAAWRGRLASTWRAQVRWLIDYITLHVCSGPPCTGRPYGRPSVALAFRLANGWY